MQGDWEMEYADYQAECEAEAQAEWDSAAAEHEALIQNDIDYVAAEKRNNRKFIYK